jgi:L-2-amino-thiazoline-4-carboxylic acid hydrolase-like protein
MSDPTDAAIASLGILARRRIEAEILKPVYEELKSVLGVERAREVIARAVRQTAIDAGRSFAGNTPGGTSLETFRDIQPLWTKDGALEVETLRATSTQYDFNVRRCRYAETYSRMGLREIGGLLSCNRDGAFCEGYDSRLKLERTQTIMEGAAYCDFRFTLAEPERSEVSTEAQARADYREG